MTPVDLRNARDWRAALAAFDPATARSPVTPHAAQMLMTRGLNGPAEAALRDLLDQAPQHHGALLTLASLLRRMGRRDEAGEFIARAVHIETEQKDFAPEDRPDVERFLTAADDCTSSPDRAPAAYVANLFDECAETFETLLRDKLKYRGPELLLEAVTQVAGRPLENLDVLDLGCGTGLAGEVFRAAARRMDGVDLSPKILAQAEAKHVYDRLDVGDLAPHLRSVTSPYDLILAADVFVYLGDLAPVFAAARGALRPGGRFAFTTEACDGGEYQLQEVRRYAHSRDYLTRETAAAGYEVRYLEESSTRTEALRPVRSFVCVFSIAE